MSTIQHPSVRKVEHTATGWRRGGRTTEEGLAARLTREDGLEPHDDLDYQAIKSKPSDVMRIRRWATNRTLPITPYLGRAPDISRTHFVSQSIQHPFVSHHPQSSCLLSRSLTTRTAPPTPRPTARPFVSPTRRSDWASTDHCCCRVCAAHRNPLHVHSSCLARLPPHRSPRPLRSRAHP